jgi:hypothetical protein
LAELQQAATEARAEYEAAQRDADAAQAEADRAQAALDDILARRAARAARSRS